jgi:CBS domain
LAKGLEILWW